MTIEWQYTDHGHLGVLTLTGYLGDRAVDRFVGAVGWTLARGTGPVIVDLSGLTGWSPGGQRVVTDAARRLTAAGRSLELAAIPADGSRAPPEPGPGPAPTSRPPRPAHRARRPPPSGPVRAPGPGHRHEPGPATAGPTP
ncbi:STAS domain-containing protein [Streptomyces sp. M19]